MDQSEAFAAVSDRAATDEAAGGRGWSEASVPISDAPAGEPTLALMAGSAEPLISALIVTYNHERYIRQALDSVLAQRTRFPFEIIVSEDRSTDSTAEIIESYVARYPDRIRLMRSEINLRDNEVLFRAMRAARGRYITFLDGDDYWVSPEKLQAQYDFMEAHPDSAITYHDVERVTDDGELVRVMKGLGHRGTIEDLIKGNFLGTCSVMVRRAALPDVPDWVRGMPAGDWPLYFLAAQFGYVDHIEGIVARYRIHGESFWATRSLPEQILMGMCMQVEIETHLDPRYAPAFDRSRRDTARHVLATVLNAPPAQPAARSGDTAQRLDPDSAATRIRLVEMQTRVNEAEAKRSETEMRVAETSGRLLVAEAGRDEAWRHANNLGNQMASFQAAATDAWARLWDTLEQLHQSEIGGLQLQTALEAAQRQAEADRLNARDAANAFERELEAVQRRAEADRQNARDTAERELQAARETAEARLRRIRRREKRLAIGLGLIIAIMAGLMLFIQRL
jgi:hypothetical protein